MQLLNNHCLQKHFRNRELNPTLRDNLEGLWEKRWEGGSRWREYMCTCAYDSDLANQSISLAMVVGSGMVT